MYNNLQFMNATKTHKRMLFLDDFWQIKRRQSIYYICISLAATCH